MTITQPTLDAPRPATRADRSIWFNGFHMTRLVSGEETSGRYAVVETIGRPGTEPPMHVHAHEDECFYLLEGEMTSFRGEEQIRVVPGQSVFLPRGVPHTFRIESPSTRGLILISPAGFDEFFWELGVPAPTSELPADYQLPSIESFLSVSAKFGITYPRR